jgi:hypothetical protein
MEAFVWVELGLSLIVLLAMGVLGCVVLRLAGIEGSWLVAGMSLPLGLGLTMWGWFLISAIGIPLSQHSLLWTGAGIAVVLFAVAMVSKVIRRAPKQARPSLPRSHRWADLTVVAFLAALLLISGGLSVGRSYSGWDDMSAYAAQGYAIARQGSILAVDVAGPSARGYPVGIQLAIAAFRVLGLEGLPGSKLVFSVLLGSLLAGCYGFWRRWNVPPLLACLGVIAIGTTPTIFEHSTLGYTNLPAAAFATLGTLCAVEGMERNHRGTLVISGLLLGMCAFIRPEGLLMALVVLGFAAAAHSRIHRRWPRVAVILVMLGLIAVPWMAYARLQGLDAPMSATSTSAINQLLQGKLHLDAFYWTIRYLARSVVKTFAWGSLPLLAAFVLLGGVTRGGWKLQARPLSVLASGLGGGIAMVLFYYLVSFGGDVRFWLGTGVERMFLLPVILCCVGIVALTGETRSPFEREEGSLVSRRVSTS